MTADPKLVEAVCAELKRIGGDWIDAEPHLSAEQIIAAINASGEWWVAPVEANDAMKHGYECWAYADREAASGVWECLRTAYLAKTEETAK